MALVAGHRLGPYQIEEPIGAGGMGEVYRARDVRLDRTVAIKVLPERVAGDQSLRERFEREARAVASLTHPHICTLHDIGQEDGVSYLVMEYLEGETLAVRLARLQSSAATLGTLGSTTRAGMPLEQALSFGIQIADALDRAHKQGIVHRDLKPHNIMITKSGVKLLDFGLAKVEAEAAETENGRRAAEAERSKLLTQATLTGQGMMLGTLQYMAPEQVEGQRADARSDIFALGSILYEMVTGQRAFVAKGHASLIAAILNQEPAPMATVQPMVPPALERVVRQCLAKDPEDRWQSAADLRRELQWIAQGGSQIGTPAPVAERRRRRARVVRASVIALTVASAVSIGVALERRGTPPPAAELIHFEIPLRALSDPFRMALSPDGRRLVFGMPDAGGKDQLWLRPLDGVTPVPVPGTENAREPFWSPDGHFLGFAADGKLKKTDLQGGPPQVICDVPFGIAGASWSSDGTILFGVFPGNLYKVPDTGGTPALALPRGPAGPAAAARLRPWFLPDGKRFIYFDASRDQPRTGLWMGRLDGGAPRFLVETQSMGAYSDGHLLYTRGGSLVARAFDPDRVAFVGGEIPVMDGVASDAFSGRAGFAVSTSNVLAYAGPSPAREQFTWFDRSGKKIGTLGEPGRHDNFDLSADGTRVAVAIPDKRLGLGAIWVIDGRRDVASPVVESDRTSFNDPVWSPDGQRIAYTSRGVRPSVLARPALGGADEVLFEVEDGFPIVEDWSRDGRTLAVLFVADEKPVQQGAVLPLSEKKLLFVDSPGATDELRISPDGKWLAYGAAPTGRWEVFVTTVPPRPERWQISTDGGVQPRWRADGKELYYLAPDGALVAIDVKGSATKFEAGLPRRLFETGLRPRAGYDQFASTANGERFLVNLPVAESDYPSLHVLLNWTAGFKKP